MHLVVHAAGAILVADVAEEQHGGFLALDGAGAEAEELGAEGAGELGPVADVEGVGGAEHGALFHVFHFHARGADDG